MTSYHFFFFLANLQLLIKIERIENMHLHHSLLILDKIEDETISRTWILYKRSSILQKI